MREGEAFEDDFERESSPLPAPGEVLTCHPITGQRLWVPFFMLDAKRLTYQPGAMPLLRGSSETADDADARVHQQQDELRALLERLAYLILEVEADWNEARAAGDVAHARRIRLFVLEDLRRRGLWIAPSARPR